MLVAWKLNVLFHLDGTVHVLVHFEPLPRSNGLQHVECCRIIAGSGTAGVHWQVLERLERLELGHGCVFFLPPTGIELVTSQLCVY